MVICEISIFMNEIAKDYLYTFQIDDINNQILYNSCCEIDKWLRKILPPIPEDNAYGNFTSYHHTKYNLFSFACPELHKLYYQLSKNLKLIVDPSTQYYIRCWVNLFSPGKNIDWHQHWPSEHKTWHGFYCVNTEGNCKSYTDYRIPEHPEIRVTSNDGLLVIGKSNGDLHRSSPWEDHNKYRITIAFDLIPWQALRHSTKSDKSFDNYLINNFIPLLQI